VSFFGAADNPEPSHRPAGTGWQGLCGHIPQRWVSTLEFVFTRNRTVNILYKREKASATEGNVSLNGESTAFLVPGEQRRLSQAASSVVSDTTFHTNDFCTRCPAALPVPEPLSPAMPARGWLPPVSKDLYSAFLV